MPAGLTVTVSGTGSGDRPVTDKTITVTVASDERLSGSPEVIIRQVEADYRLSDDDEGGDADPTGTTNEYSNTFNLTAPGLYNVYVTADDRGSSVDASSGTKGTAIVDDKDTTDTSDDVTTGYMLSEANLEKAILFEVDTAVAEPAFDPTDDGSTDNPNVFIRVNFADEGKEYSVTTGSGDDKKVVDVDTHGTVTLVSAMLNGDDVTDDVTSRDDILFLYRPGSLSIGDHEFEIEVTDNAGNELETGIEFSVTERKPYTLSLNPGNNLISFPAAPADSDVNAVFGGEGNEDVLSVLTFNNATRLWQTAVKGADGTFAGDLTNINGMNGYWVVADGVVDVEVVLAGGDNVTVPPPHIAVTEGWNLIGVVDSQQRAAGQRFYGANYFTNIDAEVAYGYDSEAGRFERISLPATAPTGDVEDATSDLVVETGKGYWVYANEAGIIVP